MQCNAISAALSRSIWKSSRSPQNPAACFSTDELQKLVLEQMELRKKLERDFQSLKGTGGAPPCGRGRAGRH